jgi:hypothetical protein
VVVAGQQFHTTFTEYPELIRRVAVVQVALPTVVLMLPVVAPATEFWLPVGLEVAVAQRERLL